MPDTLQERCSASQTETTTKPPSALLADGLRYLEWLAYHGLEPADLAILDQLDTRQQERQAAHVHAVEAERLADLVVAADVEGPRALLAAWDRLADHLQSRSAAGHRGRR